MFPINHKRQKGKNGLGNRPTKNAIRAGPMSRGHIARKTPGSSPGIPVKSQRERKNCIQRSLLVIATVPIRAALPGATPISIPIRILAGSTGNTGTILGLDVAGTRVILRRWRLGTGATARGGGLTMGVGTLGEPFRHRGRSGHLRAGVVQTHAGRAISHLVCISRGHPLAYLCQGLRNFQVFRSRDPIPRGRQSPVGVVVDSRGKPAGAIGAMALPEFHCFAFHRVKVPRRVGGWHQYMCCLDTARTHSYLRTLWGIVFWGFASFSAEAL